jgi:NADPH2:quinone reductase
VQTLLILGAAGGAGVAALDIARVLGAVILACASTQSKRDLCDSRGANTAIDYSRRGWYRDVMEYTSHEGVSCVFDPVGGDYIYACV